MFYASQIGPIVTSVYISIHEVQHNKAHTCIWFSLEEKQPNIKKQNHKPSSMFLWAGCHKAFPRLPLEFSKVFSSRTEKTESFFWDADWELPGTLIHTVWFFWKTSLSRLKKKKAILCTRRNTISFFSLSISLFPNFKRIGKGHLKHRYRTHRGEEVRDKRNWLPRRKNIP